ncbi:lysophospholipid acyltransferase family protein [Lichenihabitans psoromatis]|uniref:lysophospholipid acyltransferase family protein n=1 Tax=Lichenihabitans psoromatis TaxID=2528642 RepID=UPI0010383A19|nr:lysophospholipid acyltransferase family protein [Lichenihabitans psoromatis]
MIFARALRRDFHAVRIAKAGPPPPADTPRLVIYMNHPSWWDAAVIPVLLAKLFPGRAGFAPVDEKMTRRYGFMPRIGAFGVAQDSRRGASVFLETAATVLARPEGLLVVTAQGRFADVRERPVRLAPGLAHLLDRTPDATLVPLAVDYPFWEERKPEALLRFGPAIAARSLLGFDKRNRHDALADALGTAMDALAADAIARDAARFTTLLDGSVGVGGVYDAWRWTRARFRGERFSAAHGEQP